MIDTVFYASTNAGKAGEVASILKELGINVVTIKDIDGYPDVEENGDTFLANALLKAEAGIAVSGMATLAEDAGLEVFELNGEPGIYSSRYLGDVPQDTKNRDIIRRLDEMENADRRARFHSAMVLTLQIDEKPVIIETEGFCYGIISSEPRGENGFGYDPVFTIPELNCTFGELDNNDKNRISHRRNALHAMAARISLLNQQD